MMYFIMLSARAISSSRSANAISGSIIQNSAACLVVLEFSALNVGPNVYMFLKAIANVSPLSCPLTVRLVSLPKKSFEKSTLPSGSLGGSEGSSVVTLNISPAPSQSDPVISGVCTYTKSLSWKNLCIAYAIRERTLKTAENVLVLARRCVIVRKYSIV